MHTWLLLALPMEGFGFNKCQCVATTSSIISPREFQRIEIVPPGAHCRKTEILWVMMFCLYTLVARTHFNHRHEGNVQKGACFLCSNKPQHSQKCYIILSLAHAALRQMSLIAYIRQICVRQAHSRISLLNLFKFLRITKKNNQTVCIDPEARWINNVISRVMRR